MKHILFKRVSLLMCLVMVITLCLPDSIQGGIPSETVGITNEVGSATFDNTVGIGSGLIGDKGIEIAEEGLKNAAGNRWYTRLGRVSKVLKWGGFVIGAVDTVRDTYTLVAEDSKHNTKLGKFLDKGLAFVGTAMGWAATVGTVVTIVATAPVTGTAAVVTGTGFAVAAAGVAITRGVVNSDTGKIVINILSGNRKNIGFAPFETPEFRENREVVKDMLGFDPYDHSGNEIPDPSTGIPVYKPNIYLYSAEDTVVRVQVYPTEHITDSLPLYEADRGWQAQIQKGSINGTEDYLFYEAKVSSEYFQQQEGWIIHRGELEKGLNNILDPYGFTAVEKQDFIDYWGQKLDASQRYAVYPQGTECVDHSMALVLSPKEDSRFRVWFWFVPIEAERVLKHPMITPIQRSGLTVVEWGGMVGGE